MHTSWGKRQKMKEAQRSNIHHRGKVVAQMTKIRPIIYSVTSKTLRAKMNALFSHWKCTHLFGGHGQYKKFARMIKHYKKNFTVFLEHTKYLDSGKLLRKDHFTSHMHCFDCFELAEKQQKISGVKKNCHLSPWLFQVKL